MANEDNGHYIWLDEVADWTPMPWKEAFERFRGTWTPKKGPRRQVIDVNLGGDLIVVTGCFKNTPETVKQADFITWIIENSATKA